MNPPGRPREFDPEVALDAAVDAFWHNGYAGTSMADLEQATGLKKGSLYKAFGDKHTLFQLSLQRYFEKQMAAHVPTFLGAATATEGVRAFMEWALARGACPNGTNRGCMAVNSVNELAQDDPVVQGMLQAALMRMLGVLTGMIERGQASGEFRTDVDAASLAEYLFTINAGFVIHEKGDFPRVGSASLVDVALSALEAKGA